MTEISRTILSFIIILIVILGIVYIISNKLENFNPYKSFTFDPKYKKNQNYLNKDTDTSNLAPIKTA